SMFAPSDGGGWYDDLRRPGNQTNNPDMIVNMKCADTGYFRLYNLQLVAGRIYFPSDTIREFVLNETAVRHLGFQKSRDAIGELVNVNGKTAPVVGVVKDFHVNSLRDPINPVVMTTIKDGYGLVNIQLNLSKAKFVIVAMEKLWNKNFPDYV